MKMMCSQLFSKIIANPKHEALNPKQIPMTKIQIFKTLANSNLDIVSNFDIRI